MGVKREKAKLKARARALMDARVVVRMELRQGSSSAGERIDRKLYDLEMEAYRELDALRAKVAP